MKLIPLKCPHLKNAKNIIPHPNYLFVLTGKAIIILDRNFEHIKTVEGLKYAYRGSLSPDQTKLLVTSNDNMFYILSLESLEITYRCSIKGGVVGIEGGGCWSPDGNSVIMIVMNKKGRSRRRPGISRTTV